MRRAYVEYLFGLAASFGDVVLSGFVSIYFEKVSRRRQRWERVAGTLSQPRSVHMARPRKPMCPDTTPPANRVGHGNPTCAVHPGPAPPHPTRPRLGSPSPAVPRPPSPSHLPVATSNLGIKRPFLPCLAHLPLAASSRQVLKSKTETYSVWDRNFQLSFWSILIYTPIMLHDNPRRPFKGCASGSLGWGTAPGRGGVGVCGCEYGGAKPPALDELACPQCRAQQEC
jgi:hypothetical protein